MLQPLILHLVAPGHTHRSLDPVVVDRRLAQMHAGGKPQDLPHLRGLEALSHVSHALGPLTQYGDRIFGTLRRQGMASDFGLWAPAHRLCAIAGRRMRPHVMRAVRPVAQTLCKSVPELVLRSVHPDEDHAQMALAAVFGAAVGNLPGQLLSMGVLPVCWTTSQTWAATKLTVLGSSYLAGCAIGYIERRLTRRDTQNRLDQAPIAPCNTVSFAACTPINDIPKSLRFVTQDGRHVFDVQELGLWFQTSQSRRNVYTNAPFSAADDARLARMAQPGLGSHLYGSMHRRWAHFALSDVLVLMQCAAVLVAAPTGADVNAALKQLDALWQRYTPAERGALDMLLSRVDGAPVSEQLTLCLRCERQRRAVGAQLYAALDMPILMLMRQLMPAAIRGEMGAAPLLLSLVSRDVAVHACLQIIDSAPSYAEHNLVPAAELTAIWGEPYQALSRS